MDIKKLIKRFSKLSFLDSEWFRKLSDIKKEFVLGIIEDAIFWVDLEKQPHCDDGFKFLAAAYGLTNARQEANDMGLKGKKRDEFIRPHQNLFTMYNPYSGNGNQDK